MKIAVTTIAKDEEKHVERWYNSCRDADYIVIADTGSSDSTVEIARDSGIVVCPIIIDPWRFDDARNAGLAMLPADTDLVITLDMDEVLSEGWRDILENTAMADQYMYHYNWSDDVYFRGNRCFRRGTHRWKHPVHEIVTPTISSPTIVYTEFTIDHLPDETKSRRQYLNLLALAVKESPSDDRLAHYYGRELYFTGNWDSARHQLVRHLSLSTWAPERAQSYRYLAAMDYDPERWLLKAIAEAPNRREPWIDLILLYIKEDRPVNALVDRVLTITTRPVDYMSEGLAWNDDYVRSLYEV